MQKARLVIGALFISLALVQTAKAQSQISFSGDGFVRGYSKDRTGDNADSGFNQYLRLKTTIKADESVNVKLGAVYSSATLQGDFRTTGTSGTHHLTSENVRLDFAHFEYIKDKYFVSVGRQVVTSRGGFLTSDDRRDRIAVARFIDQDVVVFIYDKRAEGTLTTALDDLDMYSVNYYGKKDKWLYAFQTAFFNQKKATTTNVLKLRDVVQVTPELTFVGDTYSIDGYYTYVGLGTGDAIYKDNHHALALKYTQNFPILKFEAQAIATLDGGLVASGFDTLSSVINSSAFNYQSNINLLNIGLASGAKKADESVFMTRFTKTVWTDLDLNLGAGHARTYSSTRTRVLNNSVLDAGLRYQVSKASFAKLNFGQLFGDTDRLATNLTYFVNF